jgi:hypothetical protein
MEYKKLHNLGRLPPRQRILDLIEMSSALNLLSYYPKENITEVTIITMLSIEQRILETNAGKPPSKAATDV